MTAMGRDDLGFRADQGRTPPRVKPLGGFAGPLVEAGLCYALILALDFAFGDGTRFRDVQPHPFWIPILLLAVQYGAGEALLAAFIGSVLLLAGNLPERTLAQDYYAYLLQVTLNPFLWVGAALLLGELRTRARRIQRQTERALAAANKREQDLAEAFTQLRAVKEDLEIRVAGQMRTVLTIYRAARAVERLSFGEVLLGSADLVREVLGPKAFSLYLLNQNQVEAVINEGWGENDPWSAVFTQDSRLFQSVVGGQRFLCAARKGEDKLLEGEGVLAGPLVSADTGEVVGMLKVERMDVFGLSLTTIENFRLLCEWVGTAIAKARKFEQAEADRYHAGNGSLVSGALFEREKKMLVGLGKRLGFGVAQVTVRLNSAVPLPDDTQAEMGQRLSGIINATLRGTDMAFDQRRTSDEIAVLLPGTDAAGAELVAKRLAAIVAEELAPDFPGVHVSAYGEVLHAKEAA